ncbi:MAG: type II toxin-antitoxin system VapC family toxin [Dehalococcoidia bacterium]
MILVDTSIWIGHLRGKRSRLEAALEEGVVLRHPFVIGEIACGNLRNRAELLELLGNLPTAPVADLEEALAFIEARGLMGRGIGYVDVHLLAAVELAGRALIWTADRRLARVARELGLAFEG